MLLHGFLFKFDKIKFWCRVVAISFIFIGGIFMLWSIVNSYRTEVLRALMQDVDFSKDRNNILSTVILRHIDFCNRRISHSIIREMYDYTECACQMELILYPLLSNEITKYEEVLTLNLAVIFGYRKVVETLLKFDIRQESFLMTKPYKLHYTDLYPINFAYYNGDIEIARLLMKRCPKVNYKVHVHDSNNIIRVTASMFGRETIYSNYERKDEAIKRIVATLNIPFPYLCVDMASRNKVFYMLQDNKGIISSLKGGYIPENASFAIDASFVNNGY